VQEEIEELERKIKHYRDRMYNLLVYIELNANQEEKDNLLNEYKTIKHEIANLKIERLMKLGGRENDKYKGK